MKARNFNFKIFFLLALMLVFGDVLNLTAQRDKNGSPILEGRKYGGKYSFSIGLTTTTITNDNPGKKPFFERDGTKPQIFGGSFDGAQTGFSLRLNYSVDSKGMFVVPVGLDYSFYESKERTPITYTATTYYHHTISVPTLTIGLDYTIRKWNIADAKLYGGIEARMAMVQKNNFTVNTEYTNLDSVVNSPQDSKQATTRYGFLLKLGLEGMLDYPVYVNTWVGWGVMNLIGRNDARGELLTPLLKPPYQDKQESFVQNLNFNFMIQYKF